jgi:hypothetical protein
MEIGIVLAIIGAVVGEYLGGNQGLGNLAVKEMNSYNTTALFAVIIHLSLLGFILRGPRRNAAVRHPMARVRPDRPQMICWRLAGIPTAQSARSIPRAVLVSYTVFM